MALINEKTDTFCEYLYDITEFLVLLDSEQIEIPTERVSGISIQHYYEAAVFPIFKVKVVLEPSRYYKIIQNKGNVKFKLRIQYYYRKNGNKDDVSLKRDFINDTFSLFLNENNSDYQKDLKKAANINDENDLKYIDNEIELFLFKTDTILGVRSEINEVLKDADLTTAAVHLLETAGVNKVLISPFDNTDIYPELVLPPQSIEKQLMYLNNNYGFYKNGGIIYFGLQHSYILNYAPGCTAHTKKEWTETVIYVLSSTDTRSSLSGAIIKKGDKKFYYVAKGEGIDISNNTVTDNAVSGTDAYIVSMDDGGSTSSVETKAITAAKSNKAVLFNNTSNKYMASTYAAQQYANSTVVTILVEKANLRAFNPNKKFSLIFENATLNKQYKGTYRISDASFVFTSNGAVLDVNGIIVLKKVK